ncbi:MAG: zinc ribbon domain-containing protein [Syntrophorhabdales bacterium]|jgi:putative FmdB family regulatory protein
MPIYEYECRNCEEKFEVLQKADETNDLICCPKCGTEKPERLLSAFCSVGSKGAPQAVSHSAAGHS